MELPEWIKAARERAKLTQAVLADHLGVTKGNVSAWENRRHEPSFSQMLRIAELTGHPLPIPASSSPPQATTPRHAGELVAIYRAPTLRESLDCLEHAFAAVPSTHRAALADTLAGWAREGGAKHWRTMLETLLPGAPSKPQPMDSPSPASINTAAG